MLLNPIPGESVADMVGHLAILKAQAVHKAVDQNALSYRRSSIIG